LNHFEAIFLVENVNKQLAKIKNNQGRLNQVLRKGGLVFNINKVKLA